MSSAHGGKRAAAVAALGADSTVVCELCKLQGPCKEQGLGGFLPPVSYRGKKVQVHANCAIFSPDTVDPGNGRSLQNVAKEIQRGNRLVRDRAALSLALSLALVRSA
jgi:hypothetical protein